MCLWNYEMGFYITWMQHKTSNKSEDICFNFTYFELFNFTFEIKLWLIKALTGNGKLIEIVDWN